MQSDLPLDLSNRLQQRMEELLIEIAHMRQYLAQPVQCGDRKLLPLGVIGQVMSSELQNETQEMADQTHYMAFEKGVDSWEKVKTSVYLHRKISVLVTLVGIISQLPAQSAQVQKEASGLFYGVIEQCRKLEALLNALVSEAIMPGGEQPAHS